MNTTTEAHISAPSLIDIKDSLNDKTNQLDALLSLLTVSRDFKELSEQSQSDILSISLDLSSEIKELAVQLIEVA